MAEFTMPYQRERENEDRKGGKGPKELWKPLPTAEGQLHYNNVLIPLFTPHYWKMFAPTEEMRTKLRMAPAQNGLVALDAARPIYTFYFKLVTHQVDKFNRPDGSTGYGQVLCPHGMNDYLVQSLGLNPMFETPVRCAHCEEEQRQWERFDMRWKELGVDRKTLSREGYREYLDRDPVLKSIREMARKVEQQEKYFIGIFDHDKFTGVRTPGEDEDPGTAHQGWFAPKSVHEKLIRLYDGGAQSGSPAQGLSFFQTTSSGFPVVSLVKDTMKCKKGNLRDTKYDAVFSNKFHQYPAEWLAYIQNYQAMVDPTNLLVHLITYEEGQYYVSQLKSSGNDYQPNQQQMTGGAQAMPPGMPPGMPPAGMSYGAPAQQPMMMPQGMMSPPPLPPGSNPLMPPSQPQYGQVQPPVPMGAPPVPMGAPQQQYAQPPMMPVPGMPPQGMPPQGMPAMTPGIAPPAGMPPMATPPNMPMQAPQGAPLPQGMPPAGQVPMGMPPVPQQPPAPVPGAAVPPVPIVPGFSAPPDRAPVPPAEGDGPKMRQW